MTALAVAFCLGTHVQAASADSTDTIWNQPAVVSYGLAADEHMWIPGPHERYVGERRTLGRLFSLTNRRGTQMAIVMTRKAMSFIGTPYVWGGATPHGFDCSGFVQYAFRKVGIRVPRTADVQFAAAKRISGAPRRGDLVFFQTYAPGASHVGIYLDHGKFLQAAGHGVNVARLSDPYWAHRYIGVRRVAALR